MRVCPTKLVALLLTALYSIAAIFGYALHRHGSYVSDGRQSAFVGASCIESNSCCGARHPSRVVSLISRTSDCVDAGQDATVAWTGADNAPDDCSICAMLAQLRLAQPHSGVVVQKAPEILEAAPHDAPAFSQSSIRLGDARGPPVC